MTSGNFTVFDHKEAIDKDSAEKLNSLRLAEYYAMEAYVVG